MSDTPVADDEQRAEGTPGGGAAPAVAAASAVEPARPAEPAHWAVRGLSAAIYGQVVVTSIVAALEIHEQSPPGRTFVAVVATMLVFWLAHAYAEALTSAQDWRQTRTILKQEGAMVFVALPTLVVLAVGVFGVLSRENAALVSVYVGVAMLFVLGGLAAHRNGRSAANVLLTGVVGATFGLVVIVLKVLSH